MSLTDVDGMYLVDVDSDTWAEQLDTVANYLGNVVTAQSVYVDLLDDTVDKVEFEYLERELERMHAEAQAHEDAAQELFEVIDRDPSDGSAMMAGGTSMLRQEMADMMAFSGGVAQPWDDLVVVWLTNFQATGAFGTAMQLGTALGYDEFGHVALPVMQEKFEHQRFLQEVLMETAALAILHDRSI